MSPMEQAWLLLKQYVPNAHVDSARNQAVEEAFTKPTSSSDPRIRELEDLHIYNLLAGMDIEPKLMRPAVPSDSSEAREVREMLEGDSPQRRLDIFEQRVGRPPSDEEAKQLVAESREGVPTHQSFSTNYGNLNDLFE